MPIILAKHGNHTIEAEEMADGSLDEWTHRNAAGQIMGWSAVGNRKAASSTLKLFFAQARRQDFAAFEPTPEGRRLAPVACNCNPDKLPVTWKAKKKKRKAPPPVEPRSGRGANPDGTPRNSDEWRKHLYERGKGLALVFAEVPPGEDGAPGFSLKGAKSLAEVEHRIAVARADLALRHAEREEARRRAVREAGLLARDLGRKLTAEERIGMGLLAEERKKQTHEEALARRRVTDGIRRAAARDAAALEQMKRDKANEKRRDARREAKAAEVARREHKAQQARDRRAAKKGSGP